MQQGKPELASTDAQIERLLATAFAGIPSNVPSDRYRIGHHTRKYEVEVLATPGMPEPQLSCLGTLGLWRTPLTSTQVTNTPRIELVGIFETSREGTRDALAAAAFKIMRTQKAVHSGQVFLNCMHDWYPKATVPHFFFVPANLWNFPHLQATQLGGLQIQFLQAIPITESEYQFQQEHGIQGLEARLLGASTPIWDLKRSACV